MSRHRFVRNLDLDAEMEEEEEEDGMTAEQQAQMKTSMPIARALLKDIKPPISDNAISDSLWHYYFDVDKAVSWLRKDWEKKGEATVPADLLPTPDDQPRRRTVKRQRLDTPEPPLTALQRLSLSRQSGSSSPSPSQTIPPHSAAGGGDTGTAKPKSKLAMLAEQRRAAAAATKSLPNQPIPSTAGPSTPLPTTTTASESSPSKPLSKLAQKMAAARAAKIAEADRQASGGRSISDAPTDEVHPSDSTPELDEVDGSLFPPTSTAPIPNSDAPSPFFGLLTAAHQQTALPTSSLSMHLPAKGDLDDLTRRVRSAFGPDAESPDDIVLRARQGRAGTGPTAQTIGTKT